MYILLFHYSLHFFEVEVKQSQMIAKLDLKKIIPTNSLAYFLIKLFADYIGFINHWQYPK